MVANTSVASMSDVDASQLCGQIRSYAEAINGWNEKGVSVSVCADAISSCVGLIGL